MIKSKEDYLSYVEVDRKANKIISFASSLRITWKYLKALRRYEFLLNTDAKFPIFRKVSLAFARLRLHSLSVKSGLQIPPNTFGKGLYVPHYGTIVVNETCRFGDGCVVQQGVNISENVSGGNHLYFGAGCKIIRNVKIADDVIIGANAVVTKDIIEDDVVFAGIPAKKISDNGYKNREAV